MTPEQVHYGLDKTIYQNRSEVLAAAFEKNSNRFKGKPPVPKSLPLAAWINKPATDELESNLFRSGKPRPLGGVRVNWLCLNETTRSIGVLILKANKSELNFQSLSENYFCI